MCDLESGLNAVVKWFELDAESKSSNPGKEGKKIFFPYCWLVIATIYPSSLLRTFDTNSDVQKNGNALLIFNWFSQLIDFSWFSMLLSTGSEVVGI